VIGARIEGVGAYLPPKVVTNFDLEKMMDTSDEWIRKRTGIEERRWVDRESTSALAYQASLQAIDNAGISKEEIELIIFATLSPDHDFPGAGCFLQDRLGLPGVPALDIRQQCSGFVYGMSIANQYIKSGEYRKILLVGAEVHSKGLDKSPKGRDISVLFGDGAGAVVIGAHEVSDQTKESHIYSTHLHADGRFAKELWIAAPGTSEEYEDRLNSQMVDDGLHFGYMNGKKVFVHATKSMAAVVKEALDRHQMEVKDVDLFLFHQANLRINSMVASELGIAEDRVFNTIMKYGNTTAATIPIGMNDAIAAGKLERGMLVMTAAFGSGFTWGSTLLRF
jgi:3-oxoacyl-[acyl-carrier-protein] synthase III